MIDDFVNKIICGNALEVLKRMQDESIDMCMTSPPYWALRDYGVEGQLGLEPTFQEYIIKLCDIFDEVKRILKKTGSCWVNMGDTYGTQSAGVPKSLCQIPSRFAIEMTNRSAILRNEIIWHKSNCMPSSVKDRFTVDFEKIFFFVKNKKYWFETQYEKNSSNSGVGYQRSDDNGQGRNKRCVWRIPTRPFPEAHFAVFPPELCETPIKAGCPEFVCKKCGKAREKIYELGNLVSSYEGQPIANKPRSNPANKLIKQNLPKDEYGALPRRDRKEVGYTDCGCNTGFEGGIVLDPFMGSGTTALVARQLRRQFIGIELNPRYVEMANGREVERKSRNSPIRGVQL